MVDAINKSFGMDFQIEETEKIKGLPLYMTSRRSFYIVSDETIRFLLVKVSENEKYGAIALDKQRKLYEEKSKLLVAYWFEGLSRYQRDSLISHRIPFVADGIQLYLPFLGLAIQNSFKKKNEIKTDKMMPITQSLFLYLLYICNGKRILKKDAAEFLGVTRTSITRASEQLVRMGLISQEMSGKEYYMWTENSGYELFLMAKKYLINPIQDRLVIDKDTVKNGLAVSGETALAEYSMLNPPRIENVAMDKTLARNYSFEQLDERWEEEKELLRLELWKYNPELFSKDGIVDPISLYMTMTASDDERIEGALEEMMEEYKW